MLSLHRYRGICKQGCLRLQSRTASVLHLAGFRYVIKEFLHIPGGGGAAFGAEAAVEADVFVFGHDATGLGQRSRDVEVLGQV